MSPIHARSSSSNNGNYSTLIIGIIFGVFVFLVILGSLLRALWRSGSSSEAAVNARSGSYLPVPDGATRPIVANPNPIAQPSPPSHISQSQANVHTHGGYGERPTHDRECSACREIHELRRQNEQLQLGVRIRAVLFSGYAHSR